MKNRADDGIRFLNSRRVANV